MYVFFRFLFYKINKPVKNRKDTRTIKPSPTYRRCKSRIFFLIYTGIPLSVDDATFHRSTPLPGKLYRLRTKTYSKSLAYTTVKNKQ